MVTGQWSGLPVCNVILILTLFVLLLVVYFISHLAILRNPTVSLVWVYNRTKSLDRPRKIFRWTLYHWGVLVETTLPCSLLLGIFGHIEIFLKHTEIYVKPTEGLLINHGTIFNR